MNDLIDLMMAANLAGQVTATAADVPRLSSQLRKVLDAMRDGNWHTLEELARLAGCTTQSASARVRDLRKERFGAHTVERKNMGGGLFAYRLA